MSIFSPIFRFGVILPNPIRLSLHGAVSVGLRAAAAGLLALSVAWTSPAMAGDPSPSRLALKSSAALVLDGRERALGAGDLEQTACVAFDAVVAHRAAPTREMKPSMSSWCVAASSEPVTT